MAQQRGSIHVKTNTDEFTLHGRPCELSAYSFIPTDRDVPKERTYFNVNKKDRYSHSTYNRLFLQDFGYDEKLHRCDREHHNAKDLDVNVEEKSKPVPTLSSSVYGQRLAYPLEQPERKYGRVAYVQSEFYRRNGINSS